MFFPLLNQEEKEHCLSLLIFAANSDSHYHFKEKSLVTGYSLLMGMTQTHQTMLMVKRSFNFSPRSQI